MKTRKAQKLLKKISALIENNDNGESSLDTIERDLLLSYLRQLYALILEAKVENQEEKIVAPSKDIPLQKAEPLPTPSPTTAQKPQKKKQAQAEPLQTPPKPPQTISEPEPKAQPTSKKKIPSPLKAKGETNLWSKDLEELFQLPVAKELSEKLSTLPIKDLNKAMGLNEKIFTIKELFNDDQQLFNTTLEQLNGLSSFDEARQILAEIAQRFNWTSKTKKKKAKNFIKLVSRRYK